VDDTNGVNQAGWGILTITFMLLFITTFFAARDCARAYAVQKLESRSKGLTRAGEDIGAAGAVSSADRLKDRGAPGRKDSFWRGSGPEGQDDEPDPLRPEEPAPLQQQFRNPYYPVLIGLITGWIGFPSMILCISASTFAATGDGGVFLDYQISNFGPALGTWNVPNPVFTMELVLLASVVMSFLMWVQVSVWSKLDRAEKTLRGIREDMKYSLLPPAKGEKKRKKGPDHVVGREYSSREEFGGWKDERDDNAPSRGRGPHRHDRGDRGGRDGRDRGGRYGRDRDDRDDRDRGGRGDRDSRDRGGRYDGDRRGGDDRSPRSRSTSPSSRGRGGRGRDDHDDDPYDDDDDGFSDRRRRGGRDDFDDDGSDDEEYDDDGYDDDGYDDDGYDDHDDDDDDDYDDRRDRQSQDRGSGRRGSRGRRR
jgi:hypothetical protein